MQVKGKCHRRERTPPRLGTAAHSHRRCPLNWRSVLAWWFSTKSVLTLLPTSNWGESIAAENIPLSLKRVFTTCFATMDRKN